MFRDPYYDRLFSWLPELLWGLLILLIGFIVARVVEKALYKRLRKSRVNERMGVSDPKWNMEKIISKVVFFGILLLAVLLFFNMMNMNMIASPFINMYSGISGAILGILKAALILLLAWIIALVVKKAILMLGHRLPIHKYAIKTGASPEKVNQAKWVDTAANIAFYLLLLLFMPAVLHALGLSGVSGPFEGMLNSFLNFIPKLIGAALIFTVGFLVAKIIRTILTKFLQTIGTDRLGDRLRVSSFLNGTTISKAIGTIVFILIMIPVVISSLEVLDLEGISQPAIAMLNDIMTMLPKIAVAVLLIVIGVMAARWVKGVVVSLLENMGIHSIMSKMGFKTSKTASPSMADIIGTIVQIVIILLFTVEALQIMNLHFMVTLATAIFAYLPMVIAAIIILAIGFALANLAERFVGSIMTTKTGHPHIIRYVAKYSILIFAFFMALSQLGIAPAIINAAFILTLGGVALAFGLAFGLGGKEKAANYLSKMENSLQEANVSKENWEESKQEMQHKKEEVKEQAKEGAEQTDATDGLLKEQHSVQSDEPLNPDLRKPFTPGSDDTKTNSTEQIDRGMTGPPHIDETPPKDPNSNW